MPRMSVADRRARLIDAAIAVMARDGVAHATTRAIVAEAGMQIGVFHYCFRSKDELVREVARTIDDRSFEAVGEVLAGTTDPHELIRGCIEAYWQHVKQSPRERLLIFELTHHSLRQPGWELAARTHRSIDLDRVRALLDAGAELASISWRSPVDLLARYVLSTIEGILYQWLVDGDPDGAEELFARLVELLHDEAGLVPTR